MSSRTPEFTVRRDVPTYWPYFLAFVLIPIPAIVAALRSFTFEHSRWQESDYAVSTDSGDDDE